MAYKESVAKCVSKEDLVLLNDDKLFFTLIQKEFERELSDRLIGILKSNSEVIVKQSDIRAFDMNIMNQIEYKQQLEWSPVTRCADCKYYNESLPPFDTRMICRELCIHSKPDDFCSYAERRE